jgi:predicted type IV restriction endonuclease
VFYACIASLGLRIIPEDVTNRGRTDFTVFTDQDRVYIFEFKVNRDEAPLQQIKKMRYFEKYRGSDRKLMMVGIVFDTDERNILKMEWEEEK